jgi:hypothetical protein
MFKGKFVVLSLVAAALVCWQVMPMSVDTASSGIVDPCSSTASVAGSNHCLLTNPAGPQGADPSNIRLDNLGAVISITVKDGTGAVVPGIPAFDFWLIGCTGQLCLCGGQGSINADSASGVNGGTSMSGSYRTGGCEDGVQVVAQGVVIADPNDCNQALCLSINVRSPDLNCDLVNLGVASQDLSQFSVAYPSTVQPYDPCMDYDCDGDVDIVDLSIFSTYYLTFC